MIGQPDYRPHLAGGHSTDGSATFDPVNHLEQFPGYPVPANEQYDRNLRCYYGAPCQLLYNLFPIEIRPNKSRLGP